MYLSGELPPINTGFDHFGYLHSQNLHVLNKPKKKVRFLDEVSFAAGSNSEKFFANNNIVENN